jgi:uncharacterized protein (DUF362 family)
MDGVICGNGAGSRIMVPYSGSLILVSDDQVSIDAAAAKMIMFTPLKIEYIHISHNTGLGLGGVDQI